MADPQFLLDLAAEQLRQATDAFQRRHPDPNHSVFVMMRFDKTNPLAAIYGAILSSLGGAGYDAVRADDRDYTHDLWGNVALCARHCQFGVAVFEEIDSAGHDPNVTLELGYMLALGRPCLILREQRVRSLPSMLAQRLYRSFDMFDIRASVSRAVLEWVRIDIEGVDFSR
jgi:hypothetical protein